MSWLLGSTTCVGEFLYGKSWPEPTQMREINDDNTKAISARMDAKRRDATWYGEVYHRRMCKTSMYITRGDSHIKMVVKSGFLYAALPKFRESGMAKRNFNN